MAPDKGQQKRDRSRQRKQKRPNVKNAPELPHEEPPNYDEQHPTFCLQHLHADFDLKNSVMEKVAKAAFAERLQALAALTWTDIRLQPRHGLGQEKLPASQLRMSLPLAFADEEEVLVLRYHGLLPMVGVRRQATFHILAIERQFGELYDHGS